MKSYSFSQGAMNYSNAYPNGQWNTWTSRSLNVITAQNGNHRTPTAQRYQLRTNKPLFCNFTAINGPYKGSYSRGYQGSFAWPGDGVSVGGTGTDNSALSNLTDSVRGNLDLSVDFAEAGQTRNMLTAVAHFVSYARQFKQDMKRYPLRAIGGKWLEYKYGWAPLLSSIYEAGSKLCSPDPQDHEITLHARSSQTGSGPTSKWTGLLFCTGTYIDSYRVEYGIVLRPKSNRLTSLGGYTSLNPANIAWELMPYSFVVDWFIDVGGYLRNAETALLYQNQFVHGYKSVSIKRVHEYRAASSWKYGGSDWVCSTSTALQTFCEKNRTVLGSYPVPRYPVLEPHLGSSRLLSAAALISQFLGRR